MKFLQSSLLLYFLLITSCSLFREESQDIRLNQIGFYQNGPKKAVIVTAVHDSFMIMDSAFTAPLYRGQLNPPKQWAVSGETVRIADFTDFRKTGTFILYVPGFDKSHPFEIRRNINAKLLLSALRSFYYQRASTHIKEQYGGKWHRRRGHEDDLITIHHSAASKERPPGALIPCPKGWYNAGDFNKYVVSAGITNYTLLTLFEHFTRISEQIVTYIPETEGMIPDILDETRWSLDWMLSMQDTSDGGVYHKVTHVNFMKPMMPAEVDYARFIVQKSTAATLNFCAVMAVTCRVFNSMIFDFDMFTEECLNAAKSAWEWAQNNPEVYYRQHKFNERYRPRIRTTAYADEHLKDEFEWAAAELFLTTGDKKYLGEVSSMLKKDCKLPSWKNVNTLGLYSLAHYSSKIDSLFDVDSLEQHIINMADHYAVMADTSAYQIPIGADSSDFLFGSNSVAANRGIALIQAYRVSGDEKYLDAAIASLDYLLGRNATGYCFITGHGKKSPRFPHHRQSQADNIPEPVPGFLVGGPNGAARDKLDYPREFPAKCYLDKWESAQTNQVAINWNASLVYLAAAIEAIMNRKNGQVYFNYSNNPYIYRDLVKIETILHNDLDFP